ncbi:ABC transporter ATP-binding protein [Geopsychrobacter electrodiphilus]|uniref:ABC transporter ATP-binding protein n=1 Tax=Geopsychrobacter electrodiphilus TaxID=225196 RepID=UPI000376B15B|nr:ABC transporter ATP-binding protein [Geopsychrobacter electrodiphilus]
MSEPILEINDLYVDFPGLERTVQAVRGCSLRIEKGTVLGLVGESGSGKSITAQTCLGLLPQSARVRGDVKVTGIQAVHATPKELFRLRGGVASMIFQNPATSMNPFFTVGRQMVEALNCHLPGDKAEIHQAVIESLQMVHMPDPKLVFNRYPHQMSGGQLQRVMIAMAIACRPQLLIADEPTTALDVTIQAQIICLLREMVDTLGLTVLFITHDLGVVASLCDRVAVMYAGQVVESGSLEKVFESAAHPYTAKLLQTVPALGGNDHRLDYIRGNVPDMAFPPSGCAFHERCERAQERCTQQMPATQGLTQGSTVRCHYPKRDVSPKNTANIGGTA